MSGRFHRFAIVLLCAALATPTIPAAAQQAPAPPAAPPGGAPAAPYAPPAGSGLPTIPAVPPVPVVGPGQPTSLADAIATSLEKNFTIQQAALQVLLDRATLAQAQAGFSPTVQFKASYTQQTASASQQLVQLNVPGVGPITVTVLGSTPPATNYGLSLAYPLYTGNALQDQVAIAQAKLASDEAVLSAQAALIVLQARQAYYNLQAAAAQVASAQRAVDASAENVRVTQAQVNVGTAPQFNLLQAQVQLATALQTLSQQKANQVAAQYTFDTVLNLPLSTAVTPTTPFGLTAPPQDPDALVQTGLRQRPELAQARANIAGAQAAIDLAKAGLRPNITVSGGPTVQTNAPFNSTPVSWSGVLALTLTVFDGGLTAAKVQAATVQLHQAQVSEQQTEQSIESQVRTAYLNLQQAAEQGRAALAGLVAAREALRIANVRLQAGVGTELDVVTAIQNLASADSAVIQAVYNYNVALAQIDQAIGTPVQF